MSEVDQLAQHFNRLRGTLCGYLESLGLPEKQERGAISTLKTLTYEIQADLAEFLEDR